VKYLKLVLADLASISKPATALALVALVAQLFPGVHINGTLIAGILTGVGVIAGFVQNLLATTGYKVVAAVKAAVGDIVKLRNPATAAAVVALVVQLVPGVSINGQLVSGILSGVGVIASFIAAQIKLANQKPAPTPVTPTPPTPPTPPSK
jgi:hypothetical protein